MPDSYYSLKGKVLHIALQQYLDIRYPKEFDFEKPVLYNCSNFFSDLIRDDWLIYIVGKIDIFNTEIGPWEFKISSSDKMITEPKPSHIQQQKYYMTMTNFCEGGLLYYLDHPSFQHDPFVKFPITMTDE
jgi:hypothetical protein